MTDSATISDEPERWLPAPDYEGLYEVSSLGRIRSLPRPRRPKMRTYGGKVLTPQVSAHPYPVVTLCRDNRDEKVHVHTLVATAFIGAPLPGQEVRHGPGGKTDNRLSNLSYGTKIENEGDKLRDGTTLDGQRNHQAKLTMEDVQVIRGRIAAGEPATLIALDYPVKAHCIRKIARGDRWARSLHSVQKVAIEVTERDRRRPFQAVNQERRRRL